jgi:hypothetical protein
MQRRFHRRALLRGASVALALPWLESLAPRAARGQAAAPTRSFIAMSFPCGTADFWRPAVAGSGDAWTLSPILAPLLPVKSHVNVLANVGNYGPFGGHIEPSNANLGAALLTCARAIVTTLPSTLTVGTSVDQVLAQQLLGRTKIDSLQVGLSTLVSSFDGLPGACSQTISWRSPTEPTYKVIDPATVFDQIVGATKPNPAGPLAAARRAKNKSVLDYVLGHATSVRAQVSRGDAQRIDGFLSSVRSLEKKIEEPATSPPACVAPPRPLGKIAVGDVPVDYDRNAHADVMIDLVVLALQCDATRVVSFMMDDVRSDFQYKFVQARTFTATGSTPAGRNVSGGIYGLNASGPLSNDYASANFWFVEKLSRLAQKLAATPTAAGTMLDDATIWFGSEMHGPNHDGLDLPIVVVGKGGGRLKTNQFVDFAQTTRKTERLSNLYLTFLRKVFDLNVATFGTAPANGGAGSTAPPNTFGAGTTVIPEILT